jgi:hypothetical protein
VSQTKHQELPATKQTQREKEEHYHGAFGGTNGRPLPVFHISSSQKMKKNDCDIVRSPSLS